MSQTLASDMVRKGLDVFLERVERSQEFSPEEARELLSSCAIPLLFLEKLWELAQGFLDRGMEGRQLTFLLKEFVDVLELGIKGFDTARQRVKAADLGPDEISKGVSMLELAGRHCLQMRNELSALLHKLETPPREVDLSSLPTGRGDREAKGYLRLEDVNARLLSRDQT